MKDLIKKIIREEMISVINNYLEHISVIREGKVISTITLISKDDVTGDKLWLFVVFKEFNGFSEYSYSFLLTDENNTPIIDDYLTKRSEVLPYLPKDIINKKQIFPIVKDMTRKLMDEQLPENIIRRTVEPLDGDSLKRYEEITKIMVDEYGYKLVSMEKDNWGHTVWKLTRSEITENNKNMFPDYKIIHEYSIGENHKSILDVITPRLTELDLKPILDWFSFKK